MAVATDVHELKLVLNVSGDYAEAGIPEYWIVNPLDETIPVLTLAGAAYVEHGVFHRGETAHSVLLAGFAVPVAEVFDAD